MKRFKVLYNQNKICSERSRDVFYANECNGFSLRLTFSGLEQYQIGKRELNIYPGNFLVINEGTKYTRKIDSNVLSNTFYIVYASDFLSDFHGNMMLSDERLLDDPFDHAKIESPVFLETIYPFKGHMKYNLLHLKDHFYDSTVDELMLDEYMYHSLLLFYKLFNQEIISKSARLNSSNAKTRMEIFKRLSIAKDYIISNYYKDINLGDISNVACMSMPHLYRTFKQTFDISPHQYLMQVRLKNASHLLKTTDYPLHEIVNMIGLNCTSTFIKLFKNKFWSTPHNYRMM